MRLYHKHPSMDVCTYFGAIVILWVTFVDSLTIPGSPMLWKIWDFQPKALYPELSLPHCQLYPDPRKYTQEREWGIFTEWLRLHNMVKFGCYYMTVRSHTAFFPY